jgi:drug/metabolite transporter (DMT)-like permease
MVGLSVLATTGQLSIYYIVKNFQPYTTAIITTVRKIITIMLSIVLFKHHIVPMQWSSRLTLLETPTPKPLTKSN